MDKRELIRALMNGRPTDVMLSGHAFVLDGVVDDLRDTWVPAKGFDADGDVILDHPELGFLQYCKVQHIAGWRFTTMTEEA